MLADMAFVFQFKFYFLVLIVILKSSIEQSHVHT